MNLNLKGIKILIIEDNEDDAFIVIRNLKSSENSDISFDIAPNIKKALYFLDQNLYDVILLDLNLPDSNGLDTFKTILENDKNSTTKVILTGLDDDSIGLEAVKLGAQDFLPKKLINKSSLKRSIVHSMERNRLIQIQKEFDNLKTDFFYFASHEIRTPMSCIKSMLEIMKLKDLISPNQQYYFETIGKEVDRLIDMVSNLMDLQQLEHGLIVLNKETFPIKNLIDEVINLHSKYINDIKLDMKEENIEVYADYNKIKQVLINLVSNAIKYSPEGVDINITVEKQQNEVVISIKDKGIGIPEENIQDLFRKFSRIYNKKQKDILGTGLGLALCKEIVNSHRGKIWVTSVLEDGSTFYFTIPQEE